MTARCNFKDKYTSQSFYKQRNLWVDTVNKQGRFELDKFNYILISRNYFPILMMKLTNSKLRIQGPFD